MPPQNAGYDIEAKDFHGNLLRYIEVKTVSESWDNAGVGLTKAQFDRACSEGELYWLYVVEWAGEEAFKIYPVNYPANRVNRFFYDKGWKELAEND